jgi:hypothetical protein
MKHKRQITVFANVARCFMSNIPPSYATWKILHSSQEKYGADLFQEFEKILNLKTDKFY